MNWVRENKFKARIGGIFYENVLEPVVCNDENLIIFKRDKDTGILGISLELKTQDKIFIAKIENNEIVNMHSNYSILKGFNRFAIIENSNSRIWCDLKFELEDKDFELDLSCILFGDSGYPVILHPNRSKFGLIDNDNPPNFSMLTLTTDFGSDSQALVLDNASAYLLNLKIENFRCGIKIIHNTI